MKTGRGWDSCTGRTPALRRGTRVNTETDSYNTIVHRHRVAKGHYKVNHGLEMHGQGFAQRLRLRIGENGYGWQLENGTRNYGAHTAQEQSLHDCHMLRIIRAEKTANVQSGVYPRKRTQRQDVV